MSIVKENLATKGFSGRPGDEFVCRQIKNRTHLEFLIPVSGLLSPYPSLISKSFIEMDGYGTIMYVENGGEAISHKFLMTFRVDNIYPCISE